MGNIVKPKTWADNDLVTYTDINSDFDTIYNEFNGNIDNSNIKNAAAIDFSKLSGTVNITGSQTVTGKKTFQATVSTITTDADTATITFDLAASNIHTVTLAGNRTLALSNIVAGQNFVIILKQDATGSRTITWWAGIKWAGASAPTLTTTANRYDIFAFIYDGTNYYGSAVGYNYA